MKISVQTDLMGEENPVAVLALNAIAVERLHQTHGQNMSKGVRVVPKYNKKSMS